MGLSDLAGSVHTACLFGRIQSFYILFWALETEFLSTPAWQDRQLQVSLNPAASFTQLT